MKFSSEKLDCYKALIQTTNLQESYQEFIQLFRYLRNELKNEFTEYTFSSTIEENQMDFAYFQLTTPELKQKGLKVQIIFVHKEFQFEVWLSGYNRKIQYSYYESLKSQNLKYILNHTPTSVDYILKSQLSKQLDISNSMLLLDCLKQEIQELITFANTL